MAREGAKAGYRPAMQVGDDRELRPASIQGRPEPRVPGIVASVGGLLVVAGFLNLLDRLPDSGTRIWGVVWSLLLEAAGIAALIRWRRRPAVSAGVAVTALGLGPLVVFLFTDPDRPERSFDTFEGSKHTITLLVLAATIGWLVAWLVGPGRRAGFYLGAALLGLWVVALLQIGSPTATEVEFFEDVDVTTPDFDPADPDFEPGTPSDPFDEDPRSDFPSNRFGGTSFVVGVAYLIGAVLLDRRRSYRAAAPTWLAALAALTLGVVVLADAIEVTGASLLAVAAGLVVVWFGSARRHRFSAWYGGFGVLAGIVALVVDVTDENTLATGLALLVIGIAVAVAGDLLTGREPYRSARPGPGEQGGPSEQPG